MGIFAGWWQGISGSPQTPRSLTLSSPSKDPLPLSDNNNGTSKILLLRLPHPPPNPKIQHTGNWLPCPTVEKQQDRLIFEGDNLYWKNYSILNTWESSCHPCSTKRNGYIFCPSIFMPHLGKQAAATLKEIRQNKRSCLATVPLALLWLCKFCYFGSEVFFTVEFFGSFKQKQAAQDVIFLSFTESTFVCLWHY
jgi:hypothetical protein